ncbi:pre-mRNA-splicing factor cwc22-like [Andrographis paniculata]|uniref:pre-mRNA-splicing factor cwc22-like n=1 Tax=Andrographis paniculata TaxID=175694 RepID=UPI0021E86237|nr:pre-mRNA-splicing factor cwc22-like [Andrographis paniculata]
MGCCLSRAYDEKKNGRIGKSPPSGSPRFEEETVKEVLSETPAIARPEKIESPFIKIAPLLDFSGTVVAHDQRRRNGAVCKKPFAAYGGNEEEVSEDVSEICSSLSESVSASTEKRGNRGDELRRRPPPAKSRSLSGEIKREKTVGRSPGRRSESSPNRAIPGRGSGYARKRDSGESSGRRSRSPVTRSEPTPARSARKAGRSPGRVGSGLGERARNPEIAGDDNPWAPSCNNNELLENPLVSLECFIFL